MCPSEKAQKIKEVRAIIASIKQHPSYNIILKELLQNIIFFVVDFQFEEYDHVEDWLRVYDLQASCYKKYPTLLNPVIHPDYLQGKPECFKKEFEEIKSFFEYARKCVAA